VGCVQHLLDLRVDRLGGPLAVVLLLDGIMWRAMSVARRRSSEGPVETSPKIHSSAIGQYPGQAERRAMTKSTASGHAGASCVFLLKTSATTISGPHVPLERSNTHGWQREPHRGHDGCVPAGGRRIFFDDGGHGGHSDAEHVCAGVDAGVCHPRGSFLVLAITMFNLHRRRRPHPLRHHSLPAPSGDDGREPPQVYGSTQIELAWTVVPFLIVIVLFLTTTRYIFAIEGRSVTRDALQVTIVGNQWWWEIRYPGLGIVTANELHVPVSDPADRGRRSSRCSPPT